MLSAGRDSTNINDFALVALLGLLGLRVFEATGSEIDALGEVHGHRVLRVHGKGDKIAMVPLPPAVSRAIDRAVDGREHGPILRNRAGRRMDRHAATRRLRALATTAGVATASDAPTHAPAYLRHHHARRRRRPARRPDRRTARRPSNHHAIRPSKEQPGPPPQLHPRRVHGLSHVSARRSADDRASRGDERRAEWFRVLSAAPPYFQE